MSATVLSSQKETRLFSLAFIFLLTTPGPLAFSTSWLLSCTHQKQCDCAAAWGWNQRHGIQTAYSLEIPFSSISLLGAESKQFMQAISTLPEKVCLLFVTEVALLLMYTRVNGLLSCKRQITYRTACSFSPFLILTVEQRKNTVRHQRCSDYNGDHMTEKC